MYLVQISSTNTCVQETPFLPSLVTQVSLYLRVLDGLGQSASALLLPHPAQLVWGRLTSSLGSKPCSHLTIITKSQGKALGDSFLLLLLPLGHQMPV